MDQNPDPISPSFTTSNPSGQKGRKIAIATIVAVLLFIIGYGAYYLWGSRLPQSFPADGFLLTADRLPLTPAQELNGRSGELTPLLVEGQGTAHVIDAAHTRTHGYYLIAAPDLNSANLYRQDLSNPDAGLEQLTSSPTRKFSLSLDELSGIAAYAIVGEGNEARIVAWNPATKEEKDLGLGNQPTVLTGGFFVVFKQAGTLMSANVDSGERHELLNVPGVVFEVDVPGARVVLYDPAAGELQYFSIAPMTSAGYLSSEPIATAPHELVWNDEELLVARLDEMTERLIISTRTGNELVSVPMSADSFANLGISVRP